MIHYNFLSVEDDELREDIKSMGFPIIHKHKLCCLRQELVDSFVEARYFMFIRYAAVHLQQLSAKRQQNKEQQKSIEATKEDEPEKREKDKKQKKEKDSAKKEESDSDKSDEKEKTKEELLSLESYSDIDTDVAKKIVESITDSICSGEKQETDCE